MKGSTIPQGKARGQVAGTLDRLSDIRHASIVIYETKTGEIMKRIESDNVGLRSPSPFSFRKRQGIHTMLYALSFWHYASVPLPYRTQ